MELSQDPERVRARAANKIQSKWRQLKIRRRYWRLLAHGEAGMGPLWPAVSKIQRFWRSARLRKRWYGMIDVLTERYVPGLMRDGVVDRNEWYTDAVNFRREAVWQSDSVQQALDRAWLAVRSFSQRPDGRIGWYEYAEMSRKLYLALMRRNDPDEALELARMDWAHDTRGNPGRGLDRKAFCESWFELADVNTKSMDAGVYARFITKLVDTIVHLDEKTGACELRADFEVMGIVSKAAGGHVESRVRWVVAFGKSTTLRRGLPGRVVNDRPLTSIPAFARAGSAHAVLAAPEGAQMEREVLSRTLRGNGTRPRTGADQPGDEDDIQPFPSTLRGGVPAPRAPPTTRPLPPLAHIGTAHQSSPNVLAATMPARNPASAGTWATKRRGSGLKTKVRAAALAEGARASNASACAARQRPTSAAPIAVLGGRKSLGRVGSPRPRTPAGAHAAAVTPDPRPLASAGLRITVSGLDAPATSLPAGAERLADSGPTQAPDTRVPGDDGAEGLAAISPRTPVPLPLEKQADRTPGPASPRTLAATPASAASTALASPAAPSPGALSPGGGSLRQAFAAQAWGGPPAQRIARASPAQVRRALTSPSGIALGKALPARTLRPRSRAGSSASQGGTSHQGRPSGCSGGDGTAIIGTGMGGAASLGVGAGVSFAKQRQQRPDSAAPARRRSSHPQSLASTLPHGHRASVADLLQRERGSRVFNALHLPSGFSPGPGARP
mmetsp:Transcript_1168/g.3300  ORF Transcript_1168/g.3300 Transcript_1168/m.3300 type:complete len:728 (-) Transcript_1168:201-2384(-)